MAKKLAISDIQADILTTALDMGEFMGERIPWSVMFICPTWSMPLAGLIKRGYLLQRKTNMFDVTPEGEAALTEWRNYTPPMMRVR